MKPNLGQPVIGLTPEGLLLPNSSDGPGVFCGGLYARAIEQAGGVPVILPLTNTPATLDPLLGLCDGLLLTGGGDVCHQFYAPEMPVAQRNLLRSTDLVRDEMEIHLIRAALAAGMPILGICRGLQVLNVALGGTLLPHVDGHRNAVPAALCDELRWEPTSAILAAMGGECRQVNSTHHQVLARVADDLRPVAWAADGQIEAAEHRTARLCWGVQFHPERLAPARPSFQRLFAAFVAAAQERGS